MLGGEIVVVFFGVGAVVEKRCCMSVGWRS